MIRLRHAGYLPVSLAMRASLVLVALVALFATAASAQALPIKCQIWCGFSLDVCLSIH